MDLSRPLIASRPAPHADPARGIFETLLVHRGEAIEQARHIARLRAGAGALYGRAVGEALERAVSAAASGHELARMRISLHPGAPAPEIGLAPHDPAAILPADEVALALVTVDGGPGPQKLIDRRWIDAIEADAGPGARPLLLTRAGALLETTRANVFLLRDGELATPPLDGSILPGVTRAVVLERARALGVAAREATLTLADLASADAVLLSGSLRLLERARVRPGARRSRHVAEALAAALDVRERH